MRLDVQVEAGLAYEVYFAPCQRRLDDTMTQHTKAKKWQSDTFREEDAAYLGGYDSESIANDSNDKVLEKGGLLYERRSFTFVGKVPF